MFPTLALGLTCVSLALRYAVKPDSRQWVPLTIGFGCATLLSGALGFVLGCRATLSATVGYAEGHADYPLLALAGISESLANLVLALLLLVPAALIAGTGGFRALRAVDRQAAFQTPVSR